MKLRAAMAAVLSAGVALGVAGLAAHGALAGETAVGLGGAARPAVRISVRGGDPMRGAVVFQKCYACHSVAAGEGGLGGPNLHGVVGRAAASEAGFDYSTALRTVATDRGLVWTAKELDRFLADPEQALPGTSMAFVGLPDARDRADVVAYLKSTARP